MGGVVITGGGGFLGWHTRAALLEQGQHATLINVGVGFDEAIAARAVSGAERVIHLAGVNRASEREVHDGNIRFAAQLSGAIARADVPPQVVVYANSTQAGNGTAYGSAKAEAGETIAGVAGAVGAEFLDLRLPNLFGEHGRPFYNAVTSTFCHLIATEGTPEVVDKELTLLHAQHAADMLLGTRSAQEQSQVEMRESVFGLLDRIRTYDNHYRRGEIPDLASTIDRDLFNTYRSYTFPAMAPMQLTRHADERGSFFEVVRSRGGNGQSSFSTTRPGVTRGDHYHRRKVERFTVLSGRARISLRRIFTREVVHFDVTGDEPVGVDMPTMWAHRITNTGSEPLYTSFWTNDVFDARNPDTVPEVV